MELDLSEEDQMMRAIAMSLGENVTMSTDKDGEKKDDEEGEKKSDEEEDKEKDKQVPEDPLEKDTIDHFAENVMCGMYMIIDFSHLQYFGALFSILTFLQFLSCRLHAAVRYFTGNGIQSV